MITIARCLVAFTVGLYIGEQSERQIQREKKALQDKASDVETLLEPSSRWGA